MDAIPYCCVSLGGANAANHMKICKGTLSEHGCNTLLLRQSGWRKCNQSYVNLQGNPFRAWMQYLTAASVWVVQMQPIICKFTREPFQSMDAIPYCCVSLGGANAANHV